MIDSTIKTDDVKSPENQAPELTLMNQSQYARHRGLSQPRIAQMIKTGQLDGAFSVDDRGRYAIDAAAADALIDATRDEAFDQQRNLFTGAPVAKPQRPKINSRLGYPHTLRGGGRAPTNQPRTFADANTMEKTYKAKLAELKYLEQRGALVSKEEIDKQAREIGKLIRARLEAIPARLAPTVAGLTDPVDVAERLKIEINQLLNDLSDNVSSLPFS